MSEIGARVRRPFAWLALTYLSLGMLSLSQTWAVWRPTLTVEFTLLLVSVMVVENFAVALPGYGISLAYPLAFAALVLCGPTEALLVSAFSMINITDIRAKYPVLVHVFNLGQQLLCMALAGWVYLALGGRVMAQTIGSAVGMTAADFPQILLPLAATAVVGASGNVLLAATGYAARQGKPLFSVLKSVLWVLSAQITMAAVGFLVAQVMTVSTMSLPLFVLPLLVARQLFQRYNALNDAYYDTTRSLIAALEAKDPYTRGHSERVVKYVEMLANALDMDDMQRREISHAALLHDVGKLAIPGDTLRKHGELTEDEWSLIRRHPEVGAGMIERIPALRKLSSTVAQHHERLDGSGYPVGLSDMHLYARILAIADSFDAMTSDRPYRPGMTHSAAHSELRRCAGSHFDADLVEIFIDANTRLPVEAREGADLRSPLELQGEAM